jgi:hypothetical protein
MYGWFARHLKDQQGEIDQEPGVEPEPDEKLWVSPNGNLNHWLHGESPFTLTRRSYQNRPPMAEAAKWKQLLRVEMPQSAKASVLKTVPSRNGLSIDAIEIANGTMFLPVWRFRPPQAKKSKGLIIVLHPQGRNAAWREEQLCQKLASQGFDVCAADVRGIGDLAPGFGPGAAAYAQEHRGEENYAWASLILGKPLVGQRVSDVLALVRGLQAAAGETGQEMGIAALGKMTLPALLAAALSHSSVRKLYLAGGLASFRSVIESENYQYPFSDCVPSILIHQDLPAIAAELSTTQIRLAGAVDGSGSMAQTNFVKETYQKAIAMGHVSVDERENWNATALAQFFLNAIS